MATFSSDLYMLISRLNSTEKSYFKKFGYKYDKENKNELFLFNVIEKSLQKSNLLNEDFEKKIEKSFSQKEDKNLFSKTKTLLYQNILKSLRQYEKQKLREEKVFEYYQFANILNKKNLFKEALPFIKKAEKICNENEFMELQLMVLQLYAFTLSRVSSNNKNEEVLALIQKCETLGNSLQNMNFFQYLFFELAFLQKKVGVINDDVSQANIEKFETQLQTHEATSIRSKLYQLESHSVIALLKRKQAESFNLYKKTIELMDEKPAIRENNLFKYLVVYEQYLQTILLSFNIAAFHNAFEKFRSIDTPYENERVWKENSEIFLLSIHSLLTHNVAKYSNLEKRFNVLISKSDYLLPSYRKISIAYYLTIGFLMRNDFEQCLHWYHYINNHRDWGVRYDVDSATRIAASICYIKNRDYEQSSYFITNTINFYKLKGKYAIELIFMKLLMKMLKTDSKKEKHTLLKNTRDEIQKSIKNNPQESVLLSVFDMLSWIESEMHSSNFYEVWYEKNIQHIVK